MSGKAIENNGIEHDEEGNNAPASSRTTEMFGPAYVCITTAMADIVEAFGGAADAKIEPNPLKSLETELAKILSSNNLQDEHGYISQGRLLLKLQEAAKKILECVNTTTFDSYFSNVEDARDTAILKFRKQLNILAMNHGVHEDFMEWFDFQTKASIFKADRVAAGVNFPPVFAPQAYPVTPYRRTQPLVSSGSAKEASGSYMSDLGTSLRPSKVPVFEPIETGFGLSKFGEKYVNALIDRVFFNPDAQLQAPFIRFIMTASEEALKVDAGNKVIYLLDFLDHQIAAGSYGNMPKEVAHLIREGENEAVILLFHKLVLERYYSIRTKRNPDISIGKTELDVKEEEAVRDYLENNELNDSGVDDPNNSDDTVVTISGATDKDSSAVESPDVEVGSEDEKKQAKELEYLFTEDPEDEPEDTLVTGIHIPVQRYPLPGGKKVTFADGIQGVVSTETSDQSEPVTQVQYIDLGAERGAPTIPPDAPLTVIQKPIVEKTAEIKDEKKEENKPTLLQRIRQNRAFKAAVQVVAAGAMMIATGVAPNHGGHDQLNYGERSESVDSTPAPTAPPIANNDNVKPDVEDQTEVDIEFEESKFEISEKAMVGSKLLAEMINEGGFKRAPGYNGDFSSLNFRLTDNATPKQMVEVKKVYVKYEKGRIHVQKNIQSEEATFFQETNKAFERDGLGAKDHKGELRINWQGGKGGTWATVNWESNPFVKEMLIARGVVVENGATVPGNAAPDNVPINFEISPELPNVPAEVIHTMNNRVQDTLNEAIELDESDFIEVDGIEVLADADVLDDDVIELGDEDIFEIDGQEVLGMTDVIETKKPHNFLAGLTTELDTTDVDSGWV